MELLNGHDLRRRRIFIAIIDKADALHERSANWLAMLQEPLLTTDGVVVETFNNLSGFAIRRRCHVVMSNLLARLNLTVIRTDATLFEVGLRLHRERPDKIWSLTDCIPFVVMEDRNITQALAYDHHFIQAGFDALLRREPR